MISGDFEDFEEDKNEENVDKDQKKEIYKEDDYSSYNYDSEDAKAFVATLKKKYQSAIKNNRKNV